MAQHPHRPDSAADQDRRLRRMGIGLVVLFFALDGLMRSGYAHFGARAMGRSPPYLDAFLSELTGSAATAVLFFAVIVPMCRRFPVAGRRWAPHLAAHLLSVAVYTVSKTLLMWAMRAVLWPVTGLGRYEYGDLGYRITMEASNDVVSYGLLALGTHAFFAWLGLREEELRRARLEARLSEARLAALQGRLQPHFLFNTLNTISSVLYHDPRRADDLIARLSDLLRASLEAPDRPEVSLEEELDITRRYSELMEARFGDRLRVDVTVDDEARGARVPILLLQPLVENAVQYAVAPRARPGAVRVAVSRHQAPGRDPELWIRVDDDGPGIQGDPDDAVGRGVGLQNTRERLAYLFGDEASLTLENRPEGGLRVGVRMPWREAAAGA